MAPRMNSPYVPDHVISRGEIQHLLDPPSDNLPFGKAASGSELETAFKYVYSPCSSFDQASHPDYRLIMGRRGSGKSALIKAIRLGDRYDFKIVCRKEELAKWIDASIQEPDESKPGPIEIYKSECYNYFWVLVFRKLNKHTEGKLDKIRTFLQRTRTGEKSILEGILSAVQDNIPPGKLASTAGVISALMDLNRGSLKDAKEQAAEFLSDKSLVILIDNLEEYPLKTAKRQRIFGSILLSAADFQPTAEIIVKCFVPSEYFSQCYKYVTNWEKTYPRLCTLRWTARELRILIARRLAFYLFLSDRIGETIRLDDYSTPEAANELWLKHFPERVQNRVFANISEESFTYILRHTQLTPRQVIMACNEVAKASNGSFPNGIATPESIGRGVENAERQFVRGVLGVFKFTFPLAEAICQEHLRGLHMKIRLKDLQALSKKFRSASDTTSGSWLEKMLFEIGVFGRKVSDHGLDEDGHYNVAAFEPNVDGHLRVNEDDELLVHPMFIHELALRRDLRRCNRPICPIHALRK